MRLSCILPAAAMVVLAVSALFAPAQAQSLEQMAGQMIVVGFNGDAVNEPSVIAVRREVASGGIGGVMFLKKNVASLGAVREMNSAFLVASPDLPPFITIDQEGGAVERLTQDVGFKEVPSAESVARSMSATQAQSTYLEMARGLARLGFTVNFGPVTDVNVNPDNPVIAKFGRAYSAEAGTVLEYSEAFIAAHHAAGVLTSLKHFPGHGSSTDDSHEGFVDITRSWREAELEPYRALIGQGLADMVMVGHLYHEDRSAGDTQLPSSLSPDWIEGVLRDDLGYDGVVITDDLEMGAIREHFDLAETITRAVRAGVDVLLFSNTAKPRASLADEVRAILVAEAERDPAFRARIEESYARIVALKGRIGVSPAAAAAEVSPIPQPRPNGL